ncbi:MAG: hypothetical protein GWN55_04580 [Phycisphaerae bacterium]|nr:hypothetical protein [Phycisphaerae bacterium]NIV70007.1 hypothetical protein [Phycisphaerae bacterium]
MNNYSIGPTAPVFSSSGEIFFGSAISDETGGGVFRSIDNGDTWQRTSYPDTLSAWPLAINNNGDLFAGSELGLFRSTDSGESWNLITKPEFEKRKIFTFAISRITGSIFAAVVGDGVYRSTDNGNTWQLTSLPNTNIQSLVINGSGDIFAGTGGFFSANPEGVFFSEDDGDTWQKINQGLINENILELAADSYGYVYAGTRGDGVFRTVEPTL